jgi:hypothetical protein
MSVHLYCMLPRGSGDAGSVPDGLSGIGGAPIRALLVNGLEAWVSDVQPARAVPAEGRKAQQLISGVKAHDSVVETALDMGSTPVPARFGQRFDDDDACRVALEQRVEPVSRVLTALQGFIEMTLLVTPSTRRMLRDLEPALAGADVPEPDAFEHAPLGPGRAYLEFLRAKGAGVSEMRGALTRMAERITAAVGAFVRESAEHESVTRMPMLTLSHLIERGAAEAYRAIATAVPTGREFRVLVIGPRAPYSFCALPNGANGSHGMNLAD